MNQSLKNINAAHLGQLRVSQPRQKSVGSSSPQLFPQSKVFLESRLKQTPAKEFNRQKLIEQNRRLKGQVLQLAEQLDEIMAKQETKKKKYGIDWEQMLDPQTQLQRLQTKKQQIKTMHLKNELFELKKQNQYVYDESSVTQKENNIRELQIEIKNLQDEKAGLLKVRKEQQKRLSSLKNDTKYNQKIQKSKSQVAKLKEECKVLAGKTAQNEKLLLKAHEKQVSKNRKIKEVEEKIKENKDKLKKGNPNIVTIEMIAEIQDEIANLETEYKQSQKNWLEKIGNLDVQYGNRVAEGEKKLLILKEKEREAKINEIKLKEFRKLILQQKSEIKEEPTGNRQFRNKRNIKFLQKDA